MKEPIETVSVGLESAFAEIRNQARSAACRIIGSLHGNPAAACCSPLFRLQSEKSLRHPTDCRLRRCLRPVFLHGTTLPNQISVGKVQETAASAAFAQTVDATLRLSYWHETGFMRNVDYGRGKAFLSPPSSPPEIKKAMPYDEWFDSKRGIRIKYTYFDQLFLPNGDHLVSGEFEKPTSSKLNNIKGNEDSWLLIRNNMQAGIADPLKAANIKAENITDDPDAQQYEGDWKGTKAQIFVFSKTINSPLNLYWRSKMRVVVYADAATKVQIARQYYVSFPDFPKRGETLMAETTFDYKTHADDALFDAESLKKGKTEIHTVRYNPQTHQLDDIAPTEYRKDAK